MVAARPLGVSGVVSYGGILYPDEYDRAWQGTERDKTIGAMLNDPLIGAVLLGIEMLVRRVDWRVDAADESPAAEEAAQFVRECLDDMDDYWPGDTLAKVLTFLGWGWAVLEVVYKRRYDTVSRFDDGKIGWDCWELRPQPTRYGWEFDQRGKPAAFIQQDPKSYERYTIPLEKCLHFRLSSRDNSPEGMTPLRIAFDAWYNKRKIQRSEGIGVERDLAGFPVIYLPAKDIGDNSPAYQAAQRTVANIRQDAQAGAVLPGDRDSSGNRYQELMLLSSGGTRNFDTDPIIKRYANEVVTVFLANVMRTGQDSVGSYALSETQSGLFQQAIGAHLDTIAQTITEQAVYPLCLLNGINAELAPTLNHGNIESADLVETANYFTALSNTGLLENTPELRVFLHELAGLPVPSLDELTAEAEANQAMLPPEMIAQQQQPPPPPDGVPPGSAETAPGAPIAATEAHTIQRAIALFDEANPRYRGLLEADVRKQEPNGVDLLPR